MAKIYCKDKREELPKKKKSHVFPRKQERENMIEKSEKTS